MPPPPPSSSSPSTATAAAAAHAKRTRRPWRMPWSAAAAAAKVDAGGESGLGSSAAAAADDKVGLNATTTTTATTNASPNTPDDSAADSNNNNKSKDEPKISYLQLYRYADATDHFLMIAGSLCALILGVSQPVMTIVFAQLMQTLIVYGVYVDPVTGLPIKDNDKLNSDVRTGVIYLLIIGLVVTCAAYMQMAFWMYTGERQTKKIREAYLKAVLSQEVAFFDRTATGDITTRLTADIGTVQDGISDKVGMVIQNCATFLSGFVIAFAKGWKLALVLCCAFPLLAIASMLMAKTIGRGQTAYSDAYADAGAIAQEVLSSVRTVTSFSGQKKELARYKEKLDDGMRLGFRIALVNASSVGFVMMIIFSTYSLGFFYGGVLIGQGMQPGDVLNVFFSIIIGAFSLGNAGPNIAAIGSAIGAAAKIFETIDRKSPIDAFSDEGDKPEKVEGTIEFRNVNFHYPQRPDVPILKNFNLTVPVGKTVALVGASGSGKSTIVKLLERFYDPTEGTVTFDGRDIRELNVSWLRQQIGFVGQEPVLFDSTVYENLIFGLGAKDETHYAQKELDAMVEEACHTANAWNFIQTLPEGIHTPVGEAGGMMSGGQKQRIAIARAVMRQPKILLLDEATSALDTTSERIVQAALEKAAENRTTIVIAHRLSTIKNADLIVVMSDGVVIEQGKHNDLLEKKGAYAELVATQALRQNEGTVESTDELAEDAIKLDAPAAATTTAAAATAASAHSLGRKEGAAVVLDVHDGDAGAISAPPTLGKRRRRSVTQENEEELQKKREAEILKQPLPWVRLWSLNKDEWYLFMLGVLASGANGVLFPLFSLIFATIITIFGNTDAGERDKGIHFWALMFLILAIGAFVSNFASIASFATAGEKLTGRLRYKTFESLLRQDVAFFDEDRHSTGALTARLAEDANLIQGLTGRLSGTIVQTLVTVIAGLLIAFIHGWELTLIVLSIVPLIGLAGAMQIKILSGFGSKTKEAYNDSAEIANEAIDQIRTVATLTKEKKFYDAYVADIAEPHRVATRGAFLSSLGFGVSQGVIFFAYALAFYAGSQLIIIGRMTNQNVLTVMFSVVFTAISAGQATSFAPNYVKAKLAALSIFELLDRKPAIDWTSGDGSSGDGVGKVEINDAKFKYPSRPDVQVLKGLTVTAEPSKTIALVGPSGCGKSTVIALLERWYDLESGSAKYQSLEVRDWRVTALRDEMALVGQEPVLFNLSIRENIMYGAKNGTASQEEIEAVAVMANIHSFVTTLPEGYNTVVGGKGGQLSGGQKQRVAIARALIRNPKLLLLDEATSALDSESEKVVQVALDEAAKGRTTIVIAHRLSTIQTADKIFVIQAGEVVESGTFEELVALRGQFAELVAAQGLGRTKDKKKSQ